MATKRISRKMSDEAAEALCHPIQESIRKIEEDIDNKIIELYYTVPMYRELEKVREKYPNHIMVTRTVMLNNGALTKRYALRTRTRLVSNGYRCELKCSEEFINDIVIMNKELLRQQGEYTRIKGILEQSIYEAGTLANLKKTIPQAYEKIADCEKGPVEPKAKGPLKAKKEVDLKPVFKDLKRYENK